MRPFLTLVRNAASLVSTRAVCSESGSKWIKPAGRDTGLKTYNSLTRQKEPLVLAKEGSANVLIIQRGLEENVSPFVLARMYEEEFKRDMMALKVLPPAVYMRVTENIPQIVAFIEGIISNGHAYATGQGDVYFDTRSIGSRYGKLVNFGDAAEAPGTKRDPRDFALWKASKPQEPYWMSPWGRGRPGWHIECSTIASSVFGSQLDIHSGGLDLAFPHHENEIAQCEAYHKCDQWGNYFLHSGHLHLKGSSEKMSKSLKNYITIKDYLQSHSANEFRLFCLLTKYRSAIDYSDASMNEARSTLSAISAFIHNAQGYMQGQLLCQTIQESFLWERLSAAQASVLSALADDFDTPKAMDAIMSLIYHGNCQLQPVTKSNGTSRSPAVFGAMLTYIRDIMDVLGVDLLDRKEFHDDLSGVLHNVVEQLVRFRSEVRNFALSVEGQATQDLQNSVQPPRKKPHPDRVPLLKACDALRKDLVPLGVQIKIRLKSTNIYYFKDDRQKPVPCHTNHPRQTIG
uniref:Probable cysteine--tRNA ligase, mitochondrial n=1 Tax=Pygocentrus nattereri TaxID=42514 RepID=A0AAR2LLH3_PYGNA